MPGCQWSRMWHEWQDVRQRMQAEGRKLHWGKRCRNETQWSMWYENYFSECFHWLVLFTPLDKYLFCSILLSPGPCSLSDCEDYYGRCTIAEDGSGTAQCTCPTADQCSNVVRAVCGDNAKTYLNKCLLEAESCAMKYKIEVKRKGRCSEYYMTYFFNKNIQINRSFQISQIVHFFLFANDDDFNSHIPGFLSQI